MGDFNREVIPPKILGAYRWGLCAIAVAMASQGLIGAGPSNGWESLMNRSDWSLEQREGARFLSRCLDLKPYQSLPIRHQRGLLRYACAHRNGNPPLTLCWQHGTPQAVVEAYRAVEREGAKVRQSQGEPDPIGAAFQADLSDHWQTTATNGVGQGVQGQPVTLTWSIVPDGTLIAGGEVAGEGTNEPSDLRARLAELYGGSATGPANAQPWFVHFEAVFDNIAAQTGIRYQYEPNDDGIGITNFASSGGALGVRGDVRIAGHALDGDSGVLAYNYFPDNAEMIIDTSDSFFEGNGNDPLRLRNVVEHEHCHGLGLSHVCPRDSTKLMEPFINLNFTGIQFDEVYTLQRLYGDSLEVNGNVTDNDSVSKATPIEVTAGVPYSKEWLGIDDDGDTDYFSFNAVSGSLLSVRVIPSSESYLEGEQDVSTGSCTSGTIFDSSVLQDLSVAVIDVDQSTELALAAGFPAGSTEGIGSLPLAQTGTHYLRVSGGNANANQLYRLEVDVTTPEVAVVVDSVVLNRELFRGQNGAPDPGETVEFDITLRNLGELAATNVQADLLLPVGSYGFQTSADYGVIQSGAIASQGFVFAPWGECGDSVSLSLNVAADGGYAATVPVTLILGEEELFLEQDFDVSGSLPTGWSSSDQAGGTGWSIVTSASESGSRSAFAVNESRAGGSSLRSEVVSFGDSPGSLGFFHRYSTEAGYDGGVLEIKIGSSDWQDIVDAGGTFLQGGYTTAMNGFRSPLDGRMGWSGDSGGFIETAVSLPQSVVNQNVQFRWVLGHDFGVGAEGWYVDSVSCRRFSCDESGIALTLSSEDTLASESADPADSAEIRVSAAMPVAEELSVVLNASGTADAATDLEGFGDLLLPVGSDSVMAVLAAVPDGLVEGPERLQITSPDAGGVIDIDLMDGPYSNFAFGIFGDAGQTEPFDDFDGDGSSNVEELIFGTDALSAASLPSLGLLRNGADFELRVPLGSLPDGVHVDAEASTDLLEWSGDRVLRLADGFRLLGNESQGYLRLLYSVPEFDE